MNYLRYFFAAMLFWLAGNYALAQEELPLSSNVRAGKLTNGLAYYILPNKKPEQRVELRLVLNAGSINEDDDQQGLAHMCEHMAFNGTTHFKKNEIVSFLQDIGVGFGNDLNANTSFDRTIYILPIPTDKPGNLEKGFQVLEDWAHNVTYLNDDIDGERNIILEESRLGKGAADRMYRKIYPKLFKGSLYGNRLPIGLDSIIRGFRYESLKRFYNDWYRPDLMAVVVVGDITVEKAEELINKHFSALTNPSPERKREYAPVPPYSANDAIVVTDKEATRYNIYIQYSNFEKKPVISESGYKYHIIQSLFTAIFNQRLQELTQRPNPPFIFTQADFGSFARGYDAFSLYGSAGTQNPQNACEAILTETERLIRYGFTDAELTRAKKNYVSSLEKAYNNRDKTESSDLAEELITYFLEGDIMPGIEKEFELTKKLMPDISLKDVDSLLVFLKGDARKLVAVMGPDQPKGFTLPDSSTLLHSFDEIAKADIKPYTENLIAENLLAKPPVPGKIIAKVINKTLGTTELTLSNGAKVILKKTDFKDDEIVLSANRWGGTNAYAVQDKQSAFFATQVVSAMGYGNFTPTDLKKFLSGKTASLSTSLSDTKDGFSGKSSVKDFETMMQLLYLKATSPRKDTALFSSFIKKQQAQYGMLLASPVNAFIDTTYKVFYNANPLSPIIVPHADDFDKINIERSLHIYRAHFGNANGMVFSIVGNVDEKDVLPLIEKYIASLPSGKEGFTYTDNKVRPVKGKNTLTFYKGQEEKSFVVAIFSGQIPFSEDIDLKAQALIEVLNIRIIEELREKIQGIYGGGIFGGLEKYPYPSYSFIAQLPCGPEKADTLITAFLSEIKKVRTEGISETYLNKVKQQWLESHKETIKSNTAWAEQLTTARIEGMDIGRFVNYDKYVNRLTVADIKKAANIFLNGNNLLVSKLMPANKKP